MIATEPQVSPSGLYELKAAAAALGIDRSTLSRAAQTGKIKYTIRRCNNRRAFHGNDILRYWRSEI